MRRMCFGAIAALLLGRGIAAQKPPLLPEKDVAVLQFPADGKIFYGTQRSRPAWDAEEAYLTEKAGNSPACEKAIHEAADAAHKEGKIGVSIVCLNALASYEAEP